MRRAFGILACMVLVGISSLMLNTLARAGAGDDAKPAAAQAKPQNWSMNATIIEACSCPMFCQCYFNTKPAAHGGHGDAHGGHGGGGEHYCRFNNAFKVNKGSYGDVKLDGAKFWIAGDLGGDFSHGQMDWAEITFDPSVNEPQRNAIKQIMGAVYPVEWKSFKQMPDAPIQWEADKDKATARLDGGKRGEVVLERFPGNTSEPIVIKNLKYWGTPRNDGFVLMPNKVQAYRSGEKPFEFKGTNGFMITFDIKSDDVGKSS